MVRMASLYEMKKSTGFTPSIVTSAWVGHANASTTPVADVTINGRYYSAIYGETFVGQNIWAPYMSAVLAGTEAEAMPNAYIGPQQATRTTRQQTTTDSGNTQARTQESFSAAPGRR